MKIFGDKVEYREWVEEIAENAEQIGSIESAAHMAVSGLHSHQGDMVVMFNGSPAVQERAPPSEIFSNTFQHPPYPDGRTWRGTAVLVLKQDIEKVGAE